MNKNYFILISFFLIFWKALPKLLLSYTEKFIQKKLKKFQLKQQNKK